MPKANHAFKITTLLLSCVLLCGAAFDGQNLLEAIKSAASGYRGTENKKWLKQNLALFKKEISLSKKWLDTLKIDPAELRHHGIKGKKKLVELLEAYISIYPFLSLEERPSVNKRIKTIAKITQKTEFHNMAGLDDQQFKEDATSYLRLCYLLEKKGFNNGLYRREIQNILPRLNQQMPQRGVNQQMSFQFYYAYFKLKEPFPLNKAYEKGIIRGQWDPEVINDTDAYSLTHEIFAAYEYGNKPDVDFFSENDRIYLKSTLKILLERYIKNRDPDLAAELVSCLCLLKMTAEPVLKQGLSAIFSWQNPEGSFGDYERLRPIYEGYIKEGFYLHTTSVTLKALALAFQDVYAL